MFDEPISPDRKEVKFFGKHWCGPDKYPPGKDILIARYKKKKGQGGQSVDVYVCACPARFYKLKVKSGPNSVGDPQPGFEVSTGSGACRMAAEIAFAIADGMLGFKPADQPPDHNQKTASD